MAKTRFTDRSYARPLAGLLTVLALILVVVVAVGLFRGSFTKSVPVTVVAGPHADSVNDNNNDSDSETMVWLDMRPC